MIEIPLGDKNKKAIHKGYVALIDDEDYDRVSKYLWSVAVRNYIKQYAVRKEYLNGNQRMIYMHKEILDLPDYVKVHHLNRNCLDNQKANLVIGKPTLPEDIRESQEKRGSSRYKGVILFRPKSSRPWAAMILVNGKTEFIGRYKTEVAAAREYNYRALQIYGESTELNILPEEV